MNDTVLATRGLTVRFGGLLALNDLNISISRGDVIGLIGPNGSGKTTFFNTISGLVRSSSGSITFEGSDTTKVKVDQLASRGLARTFQRSRLCLPLSVFDNIAIGAQERVCSSLWHNIVRRSAFHAELRHLTQEIEDLLAKFDDGLAKKMFAQAETLGMIDRRRVEICRALLGKPSLLLLDEPSAGMTHDETNQLMDEILAIRPKFGNPTIVIVEHEMGLIERVTDHCIVLNYGQKICEGTFKQVAADPAVRRAYLGES
ncbi:ABC transporter ATP-binding protein [Phyllobacterium zundukense]|uniref:ATP-binding cassette domain-containing protein n=1 Tax=Phyllobacterium zundukense TaxID=1867719 RepID=A0ACD4CV18_9HYPH|nr:ATP-binding cassette domain-containing protein [Phyllobacterium zundukense]UXN57431.1 ATP-binding cassette domain-containing protein [Phyllobacterium zundukense]